MDHLRDIFGMVMDVTSYHQARSSDDLDGDELLLLGIGLVVFGIAFMIYAHFF
ncbi:MAG: hypothetical protein JO316_25480 [Abitibacteriaceae bacterium]|nr:hypothetical protein [Abditibacteriaceae bacterium]MBV9868723.1 hypothetical protein [Abditibacteriaceae bacterium]